MTQSECLKQSRRELFMKRIKAKAIQEQKNCKLENKTQKLQGKGSKFLLQILSKFDNLTVRFGLWWSHEKDTSNQEKKKIKWNSSLPAPLLASFNCREHNLSLKIYFFIQNLFYITIFDVLNLKIDVGTLQTNF